MRDERWRTAAGFALTAAGALLAAVGTTVIWMSTGLRRDIRGLLDLEFRGLDLVEGVVALVVAAMTLVGLVLLRRLRGSARVGIAVSLVACGVVLIALPVWVAVRAEDRAVEEIAQVVAASSGSTIEEATRRVRTDPELAVRTDASGVWLSIAGGVLVTLGGVTTLLWVRRGPADRPPEGP
ncbi:MAG: Trp biosynthesis-associated membrane protein [Actinomycetota bacterium]